MSDAKPTSMEAWFNYFQHATSITGLNGLNTSEVTDMSSMFSNCEGLTSLSLPNFNTSKVTDMSLMFYECTGLTELELPSFITTNVTDMQMMFSACTGLKKLDLNSFITSNVTNMMMMFGGCSELTTIICTSDWYNSGCASDWMFFGCEKLVGEMGTTYDEEKIDGTYAHVDGEGGLPGYFTTPNPPTYFTVRFEDYDGTVLKEGMVAEGKDAVPPVPPTRDGYTFSGWDTEYENVQSDLIVTAQYVLNATYTVTAASSDDALGEVTLTFDDKYIISKGEEPNSFTVIENAKGHLVATPKDKYSDFLMWNDEAEGFDQAERDITVTGDFDYIATFKKDSFNVVVTVNGIDPELVEITGAGKYGRGDNVTLTYTLNDEHYDFEDWRFDENKFVEEATLVFEEISSDHDVQIVFKAKFYTVSATVIPAEGGIVKGQGDYQYGSTYTLTLEPAEGWELKEWRDGEPLEEQSNELSGVVNGDITIECVLQQKTVTYTVTFYDWNGDLLFTETVEEGNDAKGPDTDPEREGYKFVGWSKPITNITSDLVVIAQYEKSGTGVPEVQGDNVQSRKVLREGVLYIMYKRAMYDVRGKRIDN
jgi:surface protein